MDQQIKRKHAMSKTNGQITPGGTSAEKLANPPSGEAGPMDSGEGHLLRDLYSDTRNEISPIEMHQIRTSSERALHDAWQREKDHNIKLTLIVANLQQQMTDMQRELNILFDKTDKNGNSVINSVQERKDIVYCTDEEELIKETEWITKGRKNKKRKMVTSPEISPQT